MINPGVEREPLPPLYNGWVAQLLEGVIPRESRATCHDCAMCSPAAVQSRPRGYYFDPSVKCCTYLPTLPNFLVGRILSDDDPAVWSGRMAVERKIREGVVATPLGLGTPPAFSVLYDKMEASAFGRSRTLRCPYYVEDGGRCGIWRNRNSVCATFFCKHVRGQLGHAFWRHSLLPLLRLVERDLTCWCLLQLEFEPDSLRLLTNLSEEGEELTAESMDNQARAERHKQLWAGWNGRECDFFVKCAELVAGLSWSDVLQICGPQVQTYARLTQQAFAKLTTDGVPSKLTAGPMQIVQMQQSTTRVSTYSPLDPVEVPNIVMACLQYFDGRPVSEVVDTIAANTGIRLELSLVRKMVDFELLVPSNSEAPTEIG